MKLNFSEEKYNIKANELCYKQNHINRTNEDALLMCLKGLEYCELDFYCNILSQMFLITPEEVYNYIQSNNVPYEMFVKLIDAAYECLKKNQTLGSKKTADGKFITTSWLTHSLYEAKVAKELAKIINLDENKAFKMGLLHDIGRKKTHDFSHTIKGFELLVDAGWEEEALSCLSHSFLYDFTSSKNRGGRFANCDNAEDGFFVDDKICAHEEQLNDFDDITKFLQNYKYSFYDLILNLADLMATDKKITEPYLRVQDIATRKIPDSKNRLYFINNLINLINAYIAAVNNENSINICRINNLDEAMEKFKEVSNSFYELYERKVRENQSSLKI